MQRCGNKAMEGRGPDHPGQNKKERPKKNDNKMRRKESGRPGLEHPRRNKQQGPPPPGLEHPGTSGGQTPGLRHPGRNKLGAAAPRTGSSGENRRPDTPDWIIRGGSSSRSRRAPEWIIRGQVAARRPGLDHPGWNQQQEPLPTRLERLGTSSGLMPRAGASRVHQAAGATADTRTRLSRDKWRVDAPDWIIRGRTRRSGHNQQGCINRINVACRPGWSVQGKVVSRSEGNKRRDQAGAAKESCAEAPQRTMPWRYSDTKMRTRPRRRSAAMMRLGPS